jgi:hypothetical protein
MKPKQKDAIYSAIKELINGVEFSTPSYQIEYLANAIKGILLVKLELELESNQLSKNGE